VPFTATVNTSPSTRNIRLLRAPGRLRACAERSDRTGNQARNGYLAGLKGYPPTSTPTPWTAQAASGLPRALPGRAVVPDGEVRSRRTADVPPDPRQHRSPLTIVFAGLAVSREAQTRTGVSIRGSSRRYDRCGPQPSASATNRSALRHASPTTRKSSSTTSARVVTKIGSNGGGPNGDFWGLLVVAATYRAEHRSSAGEPRMPVRAERAFQIVHAAAQCRRPDQLACRSRGSGPAGREGLPIGDQLRLDGPLETSTPLYL
jgi:hypothetical protein